MQNLAVPSMAVVHSYYLRDDNRYSVDADDECASSQRLPTEHSPLRYDSLRRVAFAETKT